jgi:serine/threonine-protein kinase HipA
MNAVPGSSGLSLNIDESDNALDLDLARSVAPYFRIQHARANDVIANFEAVIRSWRDVASEMGLGRAEQNAMADAFMFA